MVKNYRIFHHQRFKVSIAKPRGTGKEKTNISNMACFHCGEIGHISKYCSGTKFGYKREATPEK